MTERELQLKHCQDQRQIFLPIERAFVKEFGARVSSEYAEVIDHQMGVLNLIQYGVLTGAFRMETITDFEDVLHAAAYHDIGKLLVNGKYLNPDLYLSDEERHPVFDSHPSQGLYIADRCRTRLSPEAAGMILYSHDEGPTYGEYAVFYRDRLPNPQADRHFARKCSFLRVSDWLDAAASRWDREDGVLSSDQLRSNFIRYWQIHNSYDLPLDHIDLEPLFRVAQKIRKHGRRQDLFVVHHGDVGMD